MTMRKSDKTLGWRLSWARNQQGLTLMEVSKRTGLAIGYISQLERGLKTNPSRDTLAKLARALNVTVGWLLGENEKPAGREGEVAVTISPQSRPYAAEFLRHLSALSREELARVQTMKLLQRLSMAVEFICGRFHTHFTRVTLASELGISVRSLNDITERGVEPELPTILEFTKLTGIPLEFLTRGSLDWKLEPVLSMEQAIPYMPVLKEAVRQQVSPEQLFSLLTRVTRGR